MATRYLSRSLLTTTRQSLLFSFHRSYTAASSAAAPNSSSFLFRIRPLVAALSSSYVGRLTASTRGFASRPTASSLNDPNPNWSNRPPKETILLDGCDFEHWLVVMEKPEGDPTRDEIIDSYIKTLATVVGSEEEARMKIYSVSTRHYFAFGALVSEELSYKLKELPRVRWVLPDSYLDVKNKDYGGEPFINGQAVPYDPKYHEEWVRNNARANERNRRNDRPRNFERSRNFERRREFNNPNSGVGGPGGNMGAPPNMNASQPGAHMGGQGTYGGGAPPNYPGSPNMGGGPSSGPPHPPGAGPQSGGTPYQSSPAPNSGFNPSGGSSYGSSQNNFNPNQGGPSTGQSHPPSTGPQSGGVPPYQSGPAPNQNFNPRSGQNYYNPNQGAPQVNHQGGFPPNPGFNREQNQGNHPSHGGPVPMHNLNNQGQGQFTPQYGNGQSGYNPNMGPGQQQNQNAYPPNVGGGSPYRN